MYLFDNSFTRNNLIMNILKICIFISSFSFLFYAISYFTGPHMKNEFKRFKLEKLGILTIVLEILGAIGLLIGLWYEPLILFSSAGLALLMFLGVLVRIKLRDSLLISLPAVFYMALNAYIFYATMQL